MDPDNMYINKIQELVDKLNYYTKLYDEGHPAISDKEWDDMYFQLQKWENFEGVYLEDSPTQKVNYQVVNKLNKEMAPCYKHFLRFHLFFIFKRVII